MKLRKFLLPIFALIALSAGFLFFAPLSAHAETAYDNVYYALRGHRFILPDAENVTEVVDPSGDSISFAGGGFKATYEGEYVIRRKNGLSLLKVYKSAPEVSIVLSGELPSSMNAGETLYLPEAVGKSAIADYTGYVVRMTLGEESYEISGEDKKFTFGIAGEWTATYVFTDVFGLETTYAAMISVGNDPVIVLQKFPSEIAFGKSISLEETYGYYDGGMYECDVVLSDKIGKTKIGDDTFTPRIDGENTLIFSAAIDGKTVERSVTIGVSYEVSSLFVGSDVSVKENVNYPSGANTEKTGVLLKGNSGTKTAYAKTIDLKKLSDEKKKIIEFQPYGKKADAISEVRITLTDVCDGTNTLSVYWWLNPWNDHLSYMLVEYDDVSVAISNESQDKGVVRNTYGAVVCHNFTNVSNKNCVPFNFRYDYDELTVYSAINKNTPDYKVLDADNKDELQNWKPFRGFSGTEAYLSVEFVVSDGGGVVVSEIGGETFGSLTADDFRNAGAIRYEKTDGVGTGVVGYDYILPVAVGKDVLYGEIKAERSLEIFDGGVYRAVTESDGTLSGDVFRPLKSGKYRAAFTGRDNFGQEATKYYEFVVLSSPVDIGIGTNGIKSLSVRDDFVLPEASVSGGTGSLSVRYQIYYNGIWRAALPGERITLDGSGDLVVSVFVTDELGFCKATSYTVKVDMNKKFLVTDGMPAACGEGERVFFPVPVLLDYSEYGKEGFEEIAELYIDGEKISGEYTVPRGVKKLQAEARSKDGSISETFEIAVIPETRTDISDALVYDRENVSAEFFETGLTFTSAGDFSVRTPYAVPFYDLSVKLTFLEDAMKYSSVSVTIASAKKGEEKVTLTFSSVKAGKGSLSLNGKTYALSLESGTYNSLSAYNGRKYDSAAIAFSWGGKIRIGGNEIAEIASFDSGRKFTGFSGGNVYVSLQASGVKQKSSVVLNYIANQSFNAYTKAGDDTPAVVGFAAELKEEYEKGEIFAMPEVCSGDVLSGKTEVKLTVKSPGGKTLASGVIPEKGWEIRLEEYGYYQLIFETEDGAYNEGKKVFRLYVADKTPPAIGNTDVKGEYRKGKTFVVPEVVVTDDKSAVGDDSDPLTVYLYLKNADGKTIGVTAGESIVLSEAGEYEFIVYAFDGSMNVAYKIRKFTVR